jgi:hypothetical protein
MPEVHDTVFEDLAAQRGLTELEYLTLLDNHSDLNAFPIYSQDGKVQISRSLTYNACNGIINLLAIVPVIEWKYAKIEHDNLVLVEVIFCPPDGIMNASSPPTSAESLLIDAWLSGSPAAARGFSGAVLAKAHTSTIDLSTLSALFGALNCSYVSALNDPHPSFASNNRSAEIISGSRLLKKQLPYSRLLSRALGESAIRWRFFQFYRVLEQGYLEVILNAINADFFHDPK